MKTFANKLKSLRLKKELLLRQVAAAIDVDTSMVSKFENGERFPTREQIEKLATFFRVPENDFLVEALSDKLRYDFSEEPLAIEILKRTIKKLNLKSIND
ncbi:helix-turn-helix transcriptional regulator [Aequorivita sp. SDUM287046]|uniref:Helix-turn-helix transcriptional regulator n=1 Tax=Aequorivita aurantiaca TaxID=3053356 RepID=A0ABT8DL82_9FLAO|nr:helix-turn-helix transcriptional regulator [Aequorivita aurantiaca]MDN3723905.1 helix-turn-helix transcriptional regulator [Aequorivita aurantiaca]